MVDKKIPNITCDRFVAFLDIMGFKDRLQRDGHKRVKELLESLYPAIEDIKKLKDLALGSNNSSSKDTDGSEISFLIPVSFSDSIILISSDESLTSAVTIIAYVRYILYTAIKKGILMKGAIAYGEMTADTEKSLYFGKPLIDAYELQNDLQLYGAILHHTMEKYLIVSGLSKSFRNFLYFDVHVPMKFGKISHHILDWTKQLEEQENPVNMVSNLYNYVSGTPRIYVDNTMEFVNEIIARKAELAQKKKA